MTQFILCVPKPSLIVSQLQLRSLGNNEWLSAVARELFPDASDVRIPNFGSDHSLAGLFTDIHNSLLTSDRSDINQLTLALTELTKLCKSFAMWWGDAWSDLPVVLNKEDLVSETISQLQGPVGEVYLRWDEIN